MMDSDDPDDDPTSDLGESVATSEFTSVTTTRLGHRYEHGRYVALVQEGYLSKELASSLSCP